MTWIQVWGLHFECELFTSATPKVFATFLPFIIHNWGVGWLCAAIPSYDAWDIWDKFKKIKIVCLPRLLDVQIWWWDFNGTICVKCRLQLIRSGSVVELLDFLRSCGCSQVHTLCNLEDYNEEFDIIFPMSCWREDLDK